MPTIGWSNDHSGKLLPNFCSPPHLLRVLVVCEAVAVILSLAATQGIGHFGQHLLLLSIYTLWIGAISAAVLCLIGQHAGERLSPRLELVVSYGALLTITWIIAEITFVAGRHAATAPLVGDVGHAAFVMRSLGICAVVAALALRYFCLHASWVAGVDAQAEIRLQALQARIRPHFLFNSLNSIASLIAARPDDAEKSTEDLAVLLRARLHSDTPDMVRLADELALVEAYLRIERHRLSHRLVLDWDVAAQTKDCLVPALCLQPLVENAIGHGIASRPAGGTLTISTQMNGRQLWIRITNPLGDEDSHNPGNHQALRNIEQRLALRYDHRARLLTMEKDGRFYVDLVIPAWLTCPQD